MKNRCDKITMVGPVYPYKSGIAHYTGLLCKALRKKYDVEMISFKMQYPRLLFKQEQKDYSGKLFEVDNVKYWIHTANPFNIIRSAAKIRRQKPQLLIMQWWHPYFAPCFAILLKCLKKIPVVFICHNVFPHKRFCMDRKLTKWVLKRGSGFIVQSQSDAADLKSILPECRCITAVHPTYDNFKYLNLTKQQAREKLAIGKDEKVLLFFGFVKEYKGLKNLLRAMPQMTESYSRLRLLVVGEFDQDKEAYLELIRKLGIEEKVSLVDRFVPDEEVGGLPDVVADGRTGYIVEPDCPEEIAQAVCRYYEEHKEEEFEENIREEARRFSWERMVEHIEALWSEIECSRSRK